MIDRRLKGIKCRAVRNIRSHKGMVSAFSEGTIQYEFENLGRNLINVRWSNGISFNVFPNEIEVIERNNSLPRDSKKRPIRKRGAHGNNQ